MVHLIRIRKGRRACLAAGNEARGTLYLTAKQPWPLRFEPVEEARRVKKFWQPSAA
jgi:hypothetical protein